MSDGAKQSRKIFIKFDDENLKTVSKGKINLKSPKISLVIVSIIFTDIQTKYYLQTIRTVIIMYHKREIGA